MKKYEIERTVKYYDCDQSGKMHNVKYFYMMEDARTEIVRATGFDYATIEKQGILLPLTKNHINYSRPVAYDDKLIIRIWIKKLKEQTMQFGYEMLKGADIVASGYTEHVCLDAATGELRDFPQHIVDALQEYSA